MPSPIAATDLIATAFRKLGVLADGETMPASEANAGLQALNDVIETWSIESLSVVSGLPVAFNTVAGQSTYTIGVGGNWNGQRPAGLMSAYCTVNGVDFQIGIWALEDWMNIGVKSVQQQIIERIAYVNDYPLGKVICWPTPSAVVPVTLNYETALTQVASLATTLTFAPGYVRALQYAVAVELQAEFGGQDVSAYAKSTKAVIQRATRNPRMASFDPALTGGGGSLVPGLVA